jgi:hypothetical protein
MKLISHKTINLFMVDKIVSGSRKFATRKRSEANECAMQFSSELNLPYVSSFNQSLLRKEYSNKIEK